MRSTHSAGGSSWRWRNVPLPEPHLVGVASLVLMQRVRPRRLPGPRRVHRLVGLGLIAGGACRAAMAVRAAGQVDVADPGRLVTTGPYRASRNPMYEAWLLIHLGAGVATGSGWTVVTVPLAAGVVHRGVLREERLLATSFGAEYARYRSAVPRYRRASTQATTQI